MTAGVNVHPLESASKADVVKGEEHSAAETGLSVGIIVRSPIEVEILRRFVKRFFILN
tara:strand:- start:121 stop:294 length:174 start_codon:yes stop_codon:yes gene_type:complete